MDNSDRTLLAFIVGAAAGVLAGLLFAPEDGEKTRRRISKKAQELKDELQENLDTDKLKKAANAALTEVEKYGQKLTDMIKE